MEIGKHHLKNKKKFLWLCRQVFLSKTRNGPSYKFGVRVPVLRDMKEARLFDHQEKSNLWKEAIAKEMTNINEVKAFIYSCCLVLLQ